MSSRTGPNLPAQILLWVVGASIAGAAIGVAVGTIGSRGAETPVVLMSVLFGNVIGLTVLFSSVVLSPRLRATGGWTRAAILGICLVSGAVAGTVLVLFAFPLYVLNDLGRAVAVTALNGVVAVVVGGVVHAHEALRWRLAESLREVEEVRLVEARLREDAARAELAALQARINPHFFFNTLHTISSLLEDDPVAAQEVVQRLAELFRYTFRAADSGPVPLSDELEFIGAYLEIERARFGDRLRVVWDVDPEAREIRVPGLLLQPLVENAVTHGIAPAARGGTVTIRARRLPGRLAVEIADDGVGATLGGDRAAPDDHGLGNVRRRLHGAFGETASLDLATGPHGRGTAARLSIPLTRAAGEGADGARGYAP